jgi:hypothetical protein
MFLIECDAGERWWYAGPSAEAVLAFHRRRWDDEPDEELTVTEVPPETELTITDADETNQKWTRTAASWIAAEDLNDGRRVREIASTIF